MFKDLMMKTKRSIMLWAAAAWTALAMPPSYAAGVVRVAWYGGNWGTAFDTCIAKPFTRQTGITVIPEIGTSNTTLAKLRQQKQKPTIDVAFLDGGISELAQADGLLADLNPSAIPNMANLEPQAIYKSKDGHTYAVSAGYYSLGISYNTKQIKSPPISWNDLWNPAYAGAVIIPSPANSSGVPFIVFLAKIWGIPLDHLQPLYKKLHDLDTALYFDSSGEASNAMQSGQSIIGADFNVSAWDMADKGLPIGFAVPKEGVWATDTRLHLVKNAPNSENGAKFINQALTPASSECLAEHLYLGPAVKGVKISAAIAPKMPWGVGGSVANLNLLDWTQVNALRASITDAWNRQVANR